MASVQTNTYDGRTIVLYVSEGGYNVANHTRTVNWTLSSEGGAHNYYSVFGLSASVNGTVVANYGDVPYSKQVFPAAKGSVSGSISVDMGGYNITKYISFSITGNVYTGAVATNTGGITLSAIPLSAPSAPSSLSVSPSGIVVPGASIGFSWGAGADGTNNPVVGYTLSACGTAVATGARSATLTAPSSRGSVYGSSVITRGTYSNSGSRAGNSIQINRLPNNPTISGSDVIIEATATAPTFTVSRTGTDPDGQTVTLYYNWSNSHTGQAAIAHGGSITIDPPRSTAGNTTKTLYVWAWDGLEYSSVITRTVTRKKFTPINFNGALAERTIVNGVEIQHLNFNGQNIF